MKKLLISILTAITLVACSEEKSDKPVVKIGAILPLTSDLAVWGNSEKQGLILAQENLPTTTKYTYKLIFEDSGNENKNVQHIAQKLISVDKVDAIITMFDPAANIISSLASDNKIPHFGQSWFPQYVKDKYNYNIYADMRNEAKLIADYLKQKRIKKVQLFTVNQTGFINGTNILKKYLQDSNIIYQETLFNFGEQDFRSAINKTKKFAPQAYVIGAFAPETDILTKQIKQYAGKDVLITGLDLGLNVSNLSLYEDSVFVMPALPQNSFLDQYIKRFNDKNYLYGAAIGFISFNTIVGAYENASKDNVADFLWETNEVPSIYDVSITKEHNIIYLPSQLMSIKDGEFIEFKE